MPASVRFLTALCAMSVLCFPAFAGKFKYGLNQSHEVAINVPRPPDAYLAKKNISIQIVTVPGGFRNAADQLRLSVERILSPDFTIVNAQPEALIRIDVISFEPLMSSYSTENETVQVHVGDKQVPQKNGKITTEPVYQDRQITKLGPERSR